MSIYVIAFCILLILILLVICHKQKKLINKHLIQEKKNYLYYSICRDWLSTYNLNRPIVNYFYNLGYKHIAIYGLGDLGTLFLDEINKSSIKVEYIIDKNKNNIYANCPVITPNSDEYKSVDVVVVTVVSDFETIKSFLSKKVSCPIVSLQSVIFEA